MHYSMEEYLNHSCHKSNNTDSLTVNNPLQLWEYLQSDLDFNDPLKMSIWSKFSKMKKEIELIQTKQIDNISGFYKSALAQNIQTNKMNLSWLIKNLHNYGYLKKEKYRYRNQTAFVYFLPDVDPEIYEKFTSQYDECLENIHCKENKTITPSPLDSKLHRKDSFTVPIIPEPTDPLLDDIQKSFLEKITPEEREKYLKKKQQHKNKLKSKLLLIKHSCACPIKKWEDSGIKNVCPVCKKTMQPIFDGKVKIDGAIHYMKEYDRRGGSK